MSQKNYTKELAVVKKAVEKAPTVPVITNDQQYDIARAQYKEFSKLAKLIKEKKDPIVKPLTEALAQVKALFRPFEITLEDAQEEYSLVLTRYANAKEIARLEGLAKIENDKRLKNPETIQARKDQVVNNLEGTRKHKVLNIYDRNAIPDNFWIVDEAMVKAALKEGIDVPGARIEEVLIVTA
jgi:hypothetical protein